MSSRIAIKDYFYESRLFMTRSLVLTVMCAILVSVLTGRLFYLQVIAHDHFTTLSDGNRVKILPIPPNRGLIFDRNGILLAENLPSYRLEITPEQARDMDATLNRLTEIVNIREVDLQKFNKLRKRMRSFEGVPLRFHLNEEEVARFSVNRHHFQGVDIQAGPSRHYPLGSRAVHAVGYVGRIDEHDLQNLDTINYRGTTHIGKVGVEKSYEDILHGGVGHRQVETNAEGRILRVLQSTPPLPGRNLYLSIDARLQAATEQAFGEFKGSAVAIDPRNGSILALVSLPHYDPNPFVNGIDQAAYTKLNTDPDRPLFNRALHGQYPPGSTIKPFAGLGGLEMGLTYRNSKTFCPGFFSLPNNERKYRDWKRSGHGTVDLVSAIVESCDVYFYDLALSMGIDRMHDFLSKFGFGEATGVDLVGERKGLLPSRQWKLKRYKESWYPGETLISGIGQGFNLVTPLQLAVVTASLANFGQRIKPSILYAIQDPDTAALHTQQITLLEPVPIVDRGHWQVIIDAMQQVVHGARGTARGIAKDIQYQIAGKTGTAQVFGLKEEQEYEAKDLASRLHDHALFIAFAPVSEPRIAIAVIVENGGSGGSVAAPIARKILDQYLLGSKP